ncbi:MAG: thioredoxin [Myxococcota bacterium]|jgi:thioredoxin|nr:thioredoxin [Myxococcota bacterium]
MQEVQDSSFDVEVLQAELPVVVDFSAPWCGPCRTMEPILQALAEAYAGKVKIVKVDVSQSPGAAARFMVQAVPTFLFFKDGKVVRQLTGAMPRPKFEAAVQQLL